MERFVNRFLKLTILGLFGIALSFMSASFSRAETGGRIYLPNNAKAPKSGLRMDVDTRWVQGSGYRPIRVTLQTSNYKPSPADRILYVQFKPSNWYSNRFNSDPIVGKYIELPQGAKSKTIEILVPQRNMWNQFSVTSYEDGREIKELSGSNLAPAQYNNYSVWTEAYPSIVYVDSALPTRDSRQNWANKIEKQIADEGKETPIPDLRVLVNEATLNFNNTISQFQNNTNSTVMLRQLYLLGRMDMIRAIDLPEQWLGLTSVDLIFLSKGELESMHPDKRDVIKKWLDAGGNLCVFNVGKGEDKLEALDQLLIPNSEAGSYAKAWQKSSTANRKDLGLEKLRKSSTQYGTRYQSMVIDDKGRVAATRSLSSQKLKNAEGGDFDLRLRKSNFGMLIALSGDPFPGKPAQWEQFFSSISSARWMWYRRHGLSLVRENPDYWEFLIPGVGMAPVTSFQIFITLFVLVIGPLNYLILKKVNRLNWLIVTVPVGAFIVTSVLMLYAAFSDGFSTRERERSLTLLDQNAGTAVTWSRQAHYAGLAPSSGFRLPIDTAVYSIDSFPLTKHSSQQELEWGEYQHRTRGFFESRTTHQNLLIRPAKTERGLAFSFSEEGDLSLKNNLQSKVLVAIIIDENGKKYSVRDLEVNAEIDKLQPENGEHLKYLTNLISNSDLAPPFGFDQKAYRNLQRSQERSTRNYYQMPEASSAKPRATESRLESEISIAMLEVLTTGKPNTYLAITQDFSEVPSGVDEANVENSVQIIKGDW